MSSMYRRALRRPPLAVVGLLTSVVLVGALAAAPLAAAATTPTPTPSNRPTEPATVTALVGTAGNGVLQPNQDLQLSISVRNGTTESISGARLSVLLDSDTIDDRVELDEWLTGETDAVGTTVAQNDDVRLLPSTTAQLSIVVPAASIPFGTDTTEGTHALEVTVTSEAGTLATARNSVEWLPVAPGGRTGVAIAVPLITPNGTSGLISSTDLADYTAITGTLTRQLDSLWGRPVAIGIDPRILASIRILGESAPQSATQWLSRLEAAPNETFALQYGDADIAAQVQSGAATLLAPASLEYAVQDALFAEPVPTPTGTTSPTPSSDSGESSSAPADADALPERPTLESLLAFDFRLPAVGWAPDDTLRGTDLPTYASNGIATSIAASGNVSLPEDVGTTTTAVVGDHRLLISDAALASAFDDAVSATTDTDWRSAITAFTAQLALTQRSNDVPAVFLGVARSSAIDGYRLTQTLDALSTLPWAGDETMSAAMSLPPTADVGIVDQAVPDERLSTVVQLMKRTADVEQFASVLDEPSVLIGRNRAEQQALLGVGWTTDPTGWAQAATTSIQTTATTLQSVRIEQSSSLLQLSRDSSIPVYVRNDLPWPVTVTLQASTSNAVLDIDEASIEPTALEAKSQARVSIPVKARVGNGETTIRLQLLSATGVPIDSQGFVKTSVRADWETVGTLVFGIVLVLIFAIGIVRSIRKRRRGDSDGDDEPDPNAVLEVQPEPAPLTPKDPRG